MRKKILYIVIVIYKTLSVYILPSFLIWLVYSPYLHHPARAEAPYSIGYVNNYYTFVDTLFILPFYFYLTLKKGTLHF